MELKETMKALEALGSEQTRKIYERHGAKDFYGVKVSDLKKLIKQTGKDHNLALELYKTGNSDAMYMAGLMVDPKLMTEEILEEWIDKAYWYMLSEYTVAGVCAESPHALTLARKWIDSPSELKAAAGWAVWNGIMTLGKPEIDESELLSLLKRIEKTLQDSPDRVRYTMNYTIICMGIYIPSFTKRAYKAAETVGKVSVYRKNTSCTVPDAASYIKKVEAKNKIGIHRKKVIC